MAAQLGVGGGFIPKGAKNVDVAKDFMKYMIQPQVVNNYLKEGLGRWLPAQPSLVKSDPFWLDPSDPHRKAYVEEGVLGQTVVNYPIFNPGWAEVHAEQVWGSAEPTSSATARRRTPPPMRRLRRSKRSSASTRSSRAKRRTWHLYRSSRPAAPYWGGTRACAACAAACKARSMHGRSPSASPMSRCSSPLSSGPSCMGCGWGTSRAFTSSCSTTRSIRKRWSTPFSTC